MDQPYSWARRGGYEISSKGDKRFSAFSAKIKRFDNLTIEVLLARLKSKSPLWKDFNYSSD